MTAGVAATKLVMRKAIDATSKLGDNLRNEIAAIFGEKKPRLAVAVARGYGGTVGVCFAGENATKLRQLLYFYLLSTRIYIGARGFFVVLNLVHT